jgi:hypothetical protein
MACCIALAIVVQAAGIFANGSVIGSGFSPLIMSSALWCVRPVFEP